MRKETLELLAIAKRKIEWQERNQKIDPTTSDTLKQLGEALAMEQCLLAKRERQLARDIRDEI